MIHDPWSLAPGLGTERESDIRLLLWVGLAGRKRLRDLVRRKGKTALQAGLDFWVPVRLCGLWVGMDETRRSVFFDRRANPPVTVFQVVATGAVIVKIQFPIVAIVALIASDFGQAGKDIVSLNTSFRSFLNIA